MFLKRSVFRRTVQRGVIKAFKKRPDLKKSFVTWYIRNVDVITTKSTPGGIVKEELLEATSAVVSTDVVASESSSSCHRPAKRVKVTEVAILLVSYLYMLMNLQTRLPVSIAKIIEMLTRSTMVNRRLLSFSSIEKGEILFLYNSN